MAGNPLTDPNWAASTTDQVVQLVDNVKTKTTKPLVTAARGLVFGLLAVFIAVFIVVILLISVTRLIQRLFDLFLSQSASVAASYLFTGGLLVVAGAVLFRKRNDHSGV